MSGFDPAEFGRAFHAFVAAETGLLGFISPYLHVASLLIIVLAFVLGNRLRRAFIGFFALDWLLLLGYWGVYGAIYWLQKGPVYLAVYGMTTVLLTLIVWQWLREASKPTIDLDFRGVAAWRWGALLVAAWGFWYPTYVWSEGYHLAARDLLFSNYGLMPCPTTMVVLSLLTLNYPKGNRTLFNLLTAYAIFIGMGSVAAGWLPDIPFVLLGVCCLAMIVASRAVSRRERPSARTTGAR